MSRPRGDSVVTVCVQLSVLPEQQSRLYKVMLLHLYDNFIQLIVDGTYKT